MKNFMRWPGKKSKYKNHIIPHLPTSYSTYIEPFLGSGALFLHIAPSKWIVNDINMDVINIWQNVLKTPRILISLYSALQRTFLASNVDVKSLGHEHTNMIPKMKYTAKRAALYTFMSHISYTSHIVRNNRFYFPGFSKSIKLDNLYLLSEPYANNMYAVSNHLQKSDGQIMNSDFQVVLRLAKRNDFVFLDPPYMEDHNYQLNYNIGETLDESFMDRLLKELKKLDRKGVKWLMTQADTTQVRVAFNDYIVARFPVFRGLSQTPKYELIIKNY